MKSYRILRSGAHLVAEIRVGEIGTAWRAGQFNRYHVRDEDGNQLFTMDLPAEFLLAEIPATGGRREPGEEL